MHTMCSLYHCLKPSHTKSMICVVIILDLVWFPGQPLRIIYMYIKKIKKNLLLSIQAVPSLKSQQIEDLCGSVAMVNVWGQFAGDPVFLALLSIVGSFPAEPSFVSG